MSFLAFLLGAVAGGLGLLMLQLGALLRFADLPEVRQFIDVQTAPAP